MNEKDIRKIIKEEIKIYLEVWNSHSNGLDENAHIITHNDKRIGDVYRRVSERLEKHCN